MVQTPPDILYVCSEFHQNLPTHEFEELQKAINYCEDYSSTKIVLYSDFLGLHELEMSNRNTNITIDGLNQYGITFDRDIAQIGDGQFLKFRNMTYIRGRKVTMAQDGANFGIYDTQSAMLYISMERGRYNNAYVHRSKFYGADDQAAVIIGNPDAGVEIFDSFVKGGSRCPAILFESESDMNFSMKNSILLHGSGESDSPIENRSGREVGVRIYNSASNAILCNEGIANYVVNNNNNIPDNHIIF